MKYLFLALMFIVGYSRAQQKTENIILITLDGFRWQELFRGADTTLMRQQKFLKDDKLKEKYWRDDVNERRKALLPFFWNTIATQGQLFGNRDLGSKVNVTNQMWFSYPGYNEILTGKADDKNVDSNDKKYNPNQTVLEYLNNLPDYKGKVAAFTSWDVFPYIINDQRSKVPVSSGLVQASGKTLTTEEKLLNKMLNQIPNPLGDIRLDAFTFYYAMEYLKKNTPKVLYIAFDETDDFAHQGEYGAYLNSAHTTDGYIKELWNYLQSQQRYKNKTTLIIMVDHGRGITAESWRSHGREIEHADEIWIAVMGPDTAPNGEQRNDQHYQNQVAATLAKFLKVEYKPAHKPGEPIPSVSGN